MKFQQIVGPFTSKSTSKKIVFNKSHVNYLQVGIEYPHSIPLCCYTDEIEWPLIFNIKDSENASEVSNNWHSFVMMEKDIFEQRLNDAAVQIILNDITNPYFIINIAYEDAT